MNAGNLETKEAALPRLKPFLRITIFVSSLGSGGAERVAVRLAGWMANAGHKVQLLSLSDMQSDFYATPKNVDRVGLGLIAESKGRLSAILRNCERIWAIRRSVAKHSSEVAISLGNKNNVIMLMALGFLRCRRIISERTDPEVESIGVVWSHLRKYVYRLADLHVSQSTYVSKWLKSRIPNLNCVVIGNAIPPRDLSCPDNIDDRETVEKVTKILAVGRLVEEKGFDILLVALAIARARFETLVRLDIYGDGPDLEKLRIQKHRLGLDGVVFFHGLVPDISAAYRQADIFVLPSRFEGFPNALIEAMSFGLPVVAAKCPGGVEDILGPEPHSFGLSFPVSCEDELAECLVEIVNDTPLREQMARLAVQRSSVYSEENISNAWISVVEGL